MSNKYTEDSIQKMDPLTFTRHRPDSYLGSNEDSTQLLREIISNSSDEFLIGNCSEITIEYDKEKNIAKVSDNGQGICPNVIKDGKSVLELVYGDINSSGKYDKSEDAVYKISTGAFGIGASLTCFLSHWLIATTKRDGEVETVYFEEGKFSKRESGKCDKTEHGVSVEFNPSEEFFRDAHPNISKLKKELFNLSCVCKGLKIILNGEEFYYPAGLEEIVKDSIDNSVEIVKTRCCFEQKQSDTQIFDFCMSATSKSNCEIIPFCNYALIENGAPVSAVKSTITRCFNNWARENGIIKNKEKNLDGSSIQEGLIIAFNLVSQNIRYDSQTKVRATSTEDNPFISSVLGEQLEVWLDSNPEDAKAILEKAILARKAAEAAKRARAAVKNKKKSSGYIKMPTTLSDCWSKNRSECELIICEGKSAQSGLVAARDSKTQAIYGVRGMMISARKTTVQKFLKNQEVNNLLIALGLDVDNSTGKIKYDVNKLRYGKIIACADADAPGAAIENLLFNILWYICPELIQNGHVYSAIPPLFRVTTKNNEYVYLRDTAALEEYKKKNGNKIKSIGREKGLGEMDSKELGDTLLDASTRNIVQLSVSDIDKTEQMFEDLYGKAVQPRVEYILNHSENGEVSYE